MKRYVLLAASLAFYAILNTKALLVVLLVALCQHIFGIVSEKKKSPFLAAFFAAVLSVFLLLIRNISFRYIVAPIGISFTVLRSIGYVVDVYRGKCQAENNFLMTLLFVTFFPTALMGPVTAYCTMKAEFVKKYRPSYDKCVEGLYRIALGLFKKLIVADRLAMVVSEVVEKDMSGLVVFAMLLLYSIELYCDFAGGIDIAIGVCDILDINVPENFKSPYTARNLAVFWQKWHISMGTWFKEYVFYPLSINKRLKKILSGIFKSSDKKTVTKYAIYVSLMVTWFLTGMWHGFEGRFIVWGVLNGIILMIIRELQSQKKTNDSKKSSNTAQKKEAVSKMSALTTALCVAGTYCLVSMLRVFDCYSDVKICFMKLFSIFTFDISGFSLLVSYGVMETCIVILGVALVILNKKIFERSREMRLAGIVLFMLSVLVFGVYGQGYDSMSFIYGNM